MKTMLCSMMTLFITLGSSVHAQALPSSRIDALEQRLNRLEVRSAEQSLALRQELRQLSSQTETYEIENKSFTGLGYGASKIYFSPTPLIVGAYGEMTYSDPRGGHSASTSDLFQLSPYLGFRFRENIIFNSAFNFIHGGTGSESGQSLVEMAYLDFLINPFFNVRAGHLLVPMGYINLRREPIFYPSVARPEIETLILPTNWHENGLLVFGSWAGFEYQLGLVNGLHASSSGDLSKTSWLRGARQQGSVAQSEEFAYVARIDYYGLSGFNWGGSYYRGHASQDLNRTHASAVELWDIHGEYSLAGFGARALYTQGRLNSAEPFSTPSDVIGERVEGYYITLSYDVLAALGFAGRGLSFFTRHSQYNLHEQVPPGQSQDEEVKKTLTTLGLNYKPTQQVVIKVDYQFRRNEAQDEADLFELGLGWVF